MFLPDFLLEGLQNKDMRHKMSVKIFVCMCVCIKMQYPQRMYLHVKKELI